MHYEFEKFVGKVELDESYFGARRIRGFQGKLKRGRGTQKQPVFGIFERNDRVVQSFILMVGEDTMDLYQLDMINITEYIMVKMNFQKETECILTALNLSGHLQKDD